MANTLENRRKYGRVRCERLTCVFEKGGQEADILDISASGMRIQCKREPRVEVGETSQILVGAPNGTISLGAQVVWMKKRGFRRYELGLTFGEPTPLVKAALLLLVRTSTTTNTYFVED